MSQPDDLDRRRAKVLGRLFRRISLGYVDRVQATIAEAEPSISPTQMTVLIHLDRTGTHIAALARRARMSRQAMALRIKELEQADIVVREPDPHDRRAHLIRLTPRGDALLRGAVGVVEALDAEIRAMAGADAERFEAILRRVAEAVDPGGF